MHDDDPQFTETLLSKSRDGEPDESEHAEGEVPAELQPGDFIGRYCIRERVGEGGMGVVYAAEDRELGRVVAIKLLHTRYGGEDESQQKRLLREAQALARVSHRNLVMVFDVGSLHGRVWIAMEYVAGETLEDWLASDLRSWAEIVGVLAEAGRGLAAVHSAGLVHRDFKPGNLIVRKDGMVQVLDFGLAVRVGDEEEQRPAAPPDLDALAANLTTTGAFMGTPAYMAPEQFMMRPTDGRADQFSLCVALYEALYGHRPFKGRDMADLMSHTLEGLSGLPPEMPGLPLSVRQVIARGLARNPDDRFADMNALVEALEQTRAPPRPSSGGWRRFGLGMIAGIAVLAVGVGVWLAQEDDGAPAIVTPPAAASEPAPSDDTRRKKPTPPPMPSEPDPAEEAPPTPAAVPDVPPQAEPEVDANEDAEPDPEPAKAEPHPPSLPKPRDDPQLPIDDRTGLPSVHDREEPEDPVPEDRKPPPAEVEPVQPDDPPADDRE